MSRFVVVVVVPRCSCRFFGSRVVAAVYRSACGIGSWVRAMAVRKDVSFSLRPRALEGLIQAMTATKPAEPFEAFVSTWHAVRASLEDACGHATQDDVRMLSRLVALLLHGEWHATVLDLPPHPKLPGFCLVPARTVPQQSREQWKHLLQHDCFGQRYVMARKTLSTLAWHLSMRENMRREFLWCRRAAWLLRRLRQRWRHERESQRAPSPEMWRRPVG